MYLSAEGLLKSQRNLRRGMHGHSPFLLHLSVRWQSYSTLEQYNTETNTPYYSVELVHLWSKSCSNSYAQCNCFFPALCAWKMCPNNCISLCDPVLYLSGVSWVSLTHPPTRNVMKFFRDLYQEASLITWELTFGECIATCGKRQKLKSQKE